MHEHADEHMMERLLTDNEQLASHNKEHFDHSGCFVMNLMSAPGAGKTSLIAVTAQTLKPDLQSVVIEGDMVGELDAERLRQVGIETFQISTGRSCHLNASMVAKLLHSEQSWGSDIVFIENVGNLVCPAEYPLGEHRRIVLLSVTEGDDKPLKYPVIFRNCDVVILAKCDLLPHVEFDTEKLRRAVRGINPTAKLFELSSKTGVGLDDWLDWIRKEQSAFKAERRKLPLDAASAARGI